jgi:hypothetical protein
MHSSVILSLVLMHSSSLCSLISVTSNVSGQCSQASHCRHTVKYGNEPRGLEPRITVLLSTSSNLAVFQLLSHLRVAVMGTEKLVGEAEESFGMQRKGNIRH